MQRRLHICFVSILNIIFRKIEYLHCKSGDCFLLDCGVNETVAYRLYVSHEFSVFLKNNNLFVAELISIQNKVYEKKESIKNKVSANTSKIKKISLTVPVSYGREVAALPNSKHL